MAFSATPQTPVAPCSRCAGLPGGRPGQAPFVPRPRCYPRPPHPTTTEKRNLGINAGTGRPENRLSDGKVTLAGWITCDKQAGWELCSQPEAGFGNILRNCAGPLSRPLSVPFPKPTFSYRQGESPSSLP